MNNSNVSLIIANVWLVGAWLVHDVIGWMIMMIMSVLWIIASVVQMRFEQRIAMMKRRLRHMEMYDEHIKKCREASIKEFNKKPIRKKKK